MAYNAKFFQRHAEYLEYISGASAILPNISYCEDDMEVHYNESTPTPPPPPPPPPPTPPLSSTVRVFVYDVDGTDITTSFTVTINGEEETSKVLEIDTPYTIHIEVNTENWDILSGDTDITGVATGEEFIDHSLGVEEIHKFSGDFLTFRVKEYNTRFTFTNKNVKYSIDEGKSWSALTSSPDQYTIYLHPGQDVMWSGNVTPSTGSGIGSFSSNKSFDVEGNPLSMIYGSGFTGNTTMKDGGFRALFKDTPVVNAENLVLLSTVAKPYCYHSMFSGCTSLVTPPTICATTMGESSCYEMFTNCRNLRTAPVLPATTLAKNCYAYMFQSGTSLTNAPELPATTPADCAYQLMFWGCTSLTGVPETIPFTELATGVFMGMFQGCTSLKKGIQVPSVPPNSIAQGYAFNSMYKGCTSLEQGTDILLSGMTTIGIANEMYYNCEQLKRIKCMFTGIFNTESSKSTENWVYGVSSTGTFYHNANTSPFLPSWSNGVNGIPNGWTKVPV